MTGHVYRDMAERHLYARPKQRIEKKKHVYREGGVLGNIYRGKVRDVFGPVLGGGGGMCLQTLI